jgi:hypothetical protein
MLQCVHGASNDLMHEETQYSATVELLANSSNIKRCL